MQLSSSIQKYQQLKRYIEINDINPFNSQLSPYLHTYFEPLYIDFVGEVQILSETAKTSIKQLADNISSLLVKPQNPDYIICKSKA